MLFRSGYASDFAVDFYTMKNWLAPQVKSIAHTTVLASLFAVLLTGCFPWPHFVTIVPEVKGQVVQSGQPIANAAIFTRAGSSQTLCKGSATVAKSDKEETWGLA